MSLFISFFKQNNVKTFRRKNYRNLGFLCICILVVFSIITLPISPSKSAFTYCDCFCYCIIFFFQLFSDELI